MKAREFTDTLDEEYKAKELTKRLDDEERHRHEAIEREREADTREAEKLILGQTSLGFAARLTLLTFKTADKREEEKQRVSRRKSNRVRERKPSAEREESMRAEKREPPVERAITPATAATTTTTEGEAGIQAEPQVEAQAEPQVEPQAEPQAPAQAEPQVEPQAEPRDEISVESIVEPSASSQDGGLPEMARSQTAEGQDAAITSGAVADLGPAAATAKPESRFRTWFRDRLGRGRPRDSPAATSIGGGDASKTMEGEGGNAPAFTGGAAAATTGDVRGAALRSHPLITGYDLAQMQNGGGKKGDGDFARSNTAEDSSRRLSDREKPQPNGEHRRSWFRNNLIRIVSRSSQEPRTNGVSADGEDTDMHSGAEDQIHHDSHRPVTSEREDLRERAAEHGLPIPPAIGEQGSHSTAATARESRFSEDL